MLNALQYNFKLQQLQRSKRRVRKKYKEIYEQANRQKKSRDELEKLRYDERFDLEWIDDDIWRLQMQHISQQADKYLLPVPKFDQDSGEWIESDITRGWRLSPAALAKLRTEIRQERKGRREHWQSWLTLLTGFVGALIGLLAMLKSN